MNAADVIEPVLQIILWDRLLPPVIAAERGPDKRVDAGAVQSRHGHHGGVAGAWDHLHMFGH